MENEDKKLTEEAKAPEVKKDEKLFKKPEGKAIYQKQREDADDAEVEAFAKGELSKYHQEKAETATVQEDTETSKEKKSSNFDKEILPEVCKPKSFVSVIFPSKVFKSD